MGRDDQALTLEERQQLRCLAARTILSPAERQELEALIGRAEAALMNDPPPDAALLMPPEQPDIVGVPTDAL